MEQPNITIYRTGNAGAGGARKILAFFKALATAALLAPVTMAGFAAHAESLPTTVSPETITCNTRAEIIKDLNGGYSETPVALGVTSAGTVMELWQAPGGVTWTIVVTLPDGSSCVIGAGNDWVPIKQTARKGETS